MQPYTPSTLHAQAVSYHKDLMCCVHCAVAHLEAALAAKTAEVNGFKAELDSILSAAMELQHQQRKAITNA